MSLLDALLITLSGFGAGMVNVIVGSGTLISFPTLLFLGYSPVSANISNSLGLCAAGVSGIHGYRRELRGLGSVVKRMMPFSLVGGIAGALLLLLLPESAFDSIVPVLIGLALVLVVIGPKLRRRRADPAGQHAGEKVTATTAVVVLATAVYGGYFGAAQGVILMAALSILLPLGLQQVNGIKNVLVTLVNLVAAITFVVVAPGDMDWGVAAFIGLGALGGGMFGAKVGRVLSPRILRTVIVVVGTTAIAYLVWG